MITPRIEKALISGLATYRRWIHAYTAVSEIQIPSRHFIIITDISVNPFTDIRDADSIKFPEKLDERSTHILDLWSNNSRNSFMYRNNYNLVGVATQALFDTIINSEPIHFDTFLVFTQNVYLAISTAVGVIGNLDSSFDPLKNSQLDEAPNSYGNTEKVLRHLVDASSMKYVPTTNEEANTGVSSRQSNQPFTNVGAFGALNDPIAVNKNYATPIINIGYVIVNEKNRQDLIG